MSEETKKSETKQTESKKKKERLDVVLVAEGLAESRHKAQGMIMAGQVYLRDQKVTKAGTPIAPYDIPLLEIRGKTLAYVSRGGLKLEKAVSVWGIDLEGKTCADIGASTGGFTDCMLQNGAKLVYSVDSGYNQLDWKLRSHPQVKSMERCNARYLSRENIGDSLDFASVDVSFISLNLILPPLYPLLKEEGEVVCLIKPQFEAGREQVGKKGVVRDPAVHEAVIHKVLDEAQKIGFYVKDVTYSPIKGPEGNIEYLAYLSKEGTLQEDEYFEIDCKGIVAESHLKTEEEKQKENIVHEEGHHESAT